ncbi:5298_t:CDS:1, partial [Scutellospora calospora]
KQINCGLCIKYDGEILICRRPRQIISSPLYNLNSHLSTLGCTTSNYELSNCEFCYGDDSKFQKQDNSVAEQPVMSPLLIMYFTIPPMVKKIIDYDQQCKCYVVSSDFSNNDYIPDPVNSILNRPNTKTVHYVKLSHTNSLNSLKNTKLQKEDIPLNDLHISTPSTIENKDP